MDRERDLRLERAEKFNLEPIGGDVVHDLIFRQEKTTTTSPRTESYSLLSDEQHRPLCVFVALCMCMCMFCSLIQMCPYSELFYCVTYRVCLSSLESTLFVELS